MQQSFRNTSEDHVNSRLAYITHEDLCSSFEGDTLLAIRAPPHTHLEVPIPEDDQVPFLKFCISTSISSCYNHFSFSFIHRVLVETAVSDSSQISNSSHSCIVSE